MSNLSQPILESEEEKYQVCLQQTNLVRLWRLLLLQTQNLTKIMTILQTVSLEPTGDSEEICEGEVGELNLTICPEACLIFSGSEDKKLI